MIRLCNCTGGSVSILGSKTKRASTASCERCGGKALVDGTGSPSSGMFSTVGLELTTLINSDLTWTKVSKGNRSSSRRARKSIELGLKTTKDLFNKDSKDVDMPVSESEKLGVTVLGCHFSDKAEHVPIKKRRFLFRNPSPPPRTPSPCLEETETIVKRQQALGQGFPQNSTVKFQFATSDGAASADLGQIMDTEVNIHWKNPAMLNEQLDENEDFSGISILAAAACSNSLGGYAEEGSELEETFGHEGTPQEPMNIESKDDFGNSVKMSPEGTASCVSPPPAKEGLALLKTDHSSLKDLPLDNIKDDICLQGSAVAGLKDVFGNEDNVKIITQETSARDDRLHWDLNTVMDAWEEPFDCQHADFAANVADGICGYSDDGKRSDKKENLEGHEPQKEPKGTNDDTGKALSSDESRRLAFETEELKIEDKVDVCIDVDSAICSQGNMLSSEIDHAKDVVMDLVKKTESSHNQGKINANGGSGGSDPAKHASGPSGFDIVDENASANWVNASTTGSSEILSSHQVAIVDAAVDYFLPPKSGDLTNIEENCNVASTNAVIVNSMNGLAGDPQTCGTLSFSSQAEKQNVKNCNAASTNAVIVKSMDDFAGDPQTSGTLSFSLQAEKQNVTLPNVAFLDKATCDGANALNEDGGDPKRSFELLSDGNVLENMSCVETGHGPIDDVRVSAASESDERDSSQSFHANSVVPASGAFLGGQTVAPVDLMVQHGKDCFAHDAETDTQLHNDAVEPGIMSSGTPMALFGPSFGLNSRDACGSYHGDDAQSYGKMALEEPLEDGFDTDISQGDPGIVIGIENASDYDSQYEDGELRESSLHAWEEYDGEDDEAEHVDYGSDNRDAFNLGSENTEESNSQARHGGSFRTEVTDAGPIRERVVGTSSPCLRVQNSEKVDSHDEGSGSGPNQATRGGEVNDKSDNVKEANQSADLKIKISGWDRLPENRRSTSADMARVRDGSIRNNFTGDQKDGSDAEDIEMKVFGSRVNRRELLSRIERPASHGVFLRRDRLGIRGRSSNNDDSYPRPEREFDTVRSFGRGRYSFQRGRGGGRWADSSGRDVALKRHRSPTYHGLASFRRSAPEDLASDSNIRKGGGVGSNSQAGRHANNASSHGLYRSLRSRSPTDRPFDMHRSIRTAGEMSPGRFASVGRGRSIRYGPPVNSGGLRGRRHGPVNDDCVESSLNCSHHLSKKRRSFSPIERRVNPPARRSSSKSPSRSRTRSPHSWQSPRGRNGAAVAGNLGFRHRSRSPNFRSGARMPRVRSPNLRPGFAPDHEIGFMSAPRNRDSPPPNSRWIGYKQHSSLLDRRPPGRIHTRGERLDMEDSPRTLNPNGYCRSVHPGRFSELNGVGRGGPRHDGADDDRGKHSYRYRLVHPVKRYNLEGAVKRFCYDVEDGFVAGHESRDKEATDFHGRPKAYSRVTNGRIGDVPRSSREERSSFLCRQDRKYDANTKSFGMRESDEDVGPRRRAS